MPRSLGGDQLWSAQLPNLQKPRFVNAIFGATELSWIWLIARVYTGWNWLEAGWHKVTNDAWMNGGPTLEASGNVPLLCQSKVD